MRAAEKCGKIYSEEIYMQKIVIATVMALDRAIRNEGSTDSVYNERGIIVI